MAWMHIINQSRGLSRPLRVRVCHTFRCRLRGLMGVCELPPEEGLLFVWPRPTRLGAGVHMLFMRFPLALVWADAQGCVVDTRAAWPWRTFAFPRRPAKYLLELALERLEDFHPGDYLLFHPM